MSLRMVGKKIVTSGFLTALILAAIPVLADAAFAAVPDGAVRLGSAQKFSYRGVHCGLVNGQWRAGQNISAYFLSLIAKRSNVLAQAQRARKAMKKRLLLQAQALKRQAVKDDRTCRNQAIARNTGRLRFNFKNAKWLALEGPKAQMFADARAHGAAATHSNLRKVTASGTLEETVSAGNVEISQFLIGPNNKVYLLFGFPQELGPSGAPCLLAEVSTETGVPLCIDAELTFVAWAGSATGANNAALQFGANAIYYLGALNGSSRIVLRKYSDGTASSLTGDDGVVQDFLVLGDGSVMITGLGAEGGWIRKISADGRTVTSIYPAKATFMKLFPDGNVYFGVKQAYLLFGVERFLTAGNALDPIRWLDSWDEIFDTGKPLPHFNIRSFGCPNPDKLPGFCSGWGAYIRDYHVTANGKVYVTAGETADSTLMEYYPEVRHPNVQVKKVLVAASAGPDLLIAGLDESDNEILSLFNTTTEQEQVLLGLRNQAEVYHLSYSSVNNKAVFDALRLNDNSYVLGQIDFSLTPPLVTMTPTGGDLLVDIQTLQ